MKLEVIDVRKEYRDFYEQALTQFYNIPEEQFYNPTILPSWRINDIICHLTGNALSKLSDINKMKSQEERQEIDFESLSKMIQANNEKWISVLNNLDQNVLIELFSFSYGKLMTKFEEIEDLNAPAVHDVAWFHKDRSPCWLDIAREYTELWMHAAQIFDSLDINVPFEKPYLSLFYKITLHALNRTFLHYKDEIVLEIILGEEQYIFNNVKGFLVENINYNPNTRISMSTRSAWKLLSGISLSEEEMESIKIEGDHEIGMTFLEIESVMIKAT